MNKDRNTERKRVYSAPASIDSGIGKLPPQALDMEEAVMGAILLEKDAYHAISHILLPEAFYKESNMRICQAIINLYNRSEPADILTVTQELRKTGELEFVGGAYAIIQLTNRVASSANIEFHMAIILQQWLKREIIRVSSALIKAAYEDGADAFEVLDSLEKELMTLQQQLSVSKFDTSEKLYNQVLEDNKILTSAAGAITGVTTGYADLDKITSGWQKTDMITVAARPGMGKTAFVLCCARAAVKENKPVAVFSLEMSSIQLYKRMASQETMIPMDMILRQGMDPATEARYKLDMQVLRTAPIYIDDTPALTIEDLRRKARKFKREQKVELIIIDYLQLMHVKGSNGMNKEADITIISGGVKALAKELNIPIIALSQLSRQVENRPGGSKRPQLSDLRNSGSIEQDSDMVMFIYRAEYYGMSVDEDNNSTKGVADIIIAKNRHGALDTVTLKWKKECVKFSDQHEPEIGEIKPLGILQPNRDFTSPNQPDNDDNPY